MIVYWLLCCGMTIHVHAGTTVFSEKPMKQSLLLMALYAVYV